MPVAYPKRIIYGKAEIYFFLFTPASNQVYSKKTGDTCQCIDDNGKQCGNTSYNV